MDHHQGCVNTVRWSNNGHFLASGGDDKVVMLWQKSAFSGEAFLVAVAKFIWSNGDCIKLCVDMTVVCVN